MLVVVVSLDGIKRIDCMVVVVVSSRYNED